MAQQPLFQDAEQAQPFMAYRTNPYEVDEEKLKAIQGKKMFGKKERKKPSFNVVRQGASSAREFSRFPESRPCRDAFCILPIFVIVVFVFVKVAMLTSELASAEGLEKAELKQADSSAGNSEDKLVMPHVSTLLTVSTVAAFSSMIAAMVFTALARNAPECCVWTSLLLAPVIFCVLGFVCIVLGLMIPGLIFAASGAVITTCVFWCWRNYIPFTVAVLKVVAIVLQEHPGMIGISFLGSVAAGVWSMACALLAFEVADANSGDDGTGVDDDTKTLQANAYLVATFFSFVCGMQVIHFSCHMTYCGVFGSWYLNRDDHGSSLFRSLKVALTTSFGSICFGSLVISAIRTVEFMLAMAKDDAAREGDIVMCIIASILQCIVACIGDIVEYFSEWAYVQCAVRGTSFVESGKITYAMLTCANAPLILADLLLDSVVNFGALFCGLVGAACGAAAGILLTQGVEACAIGACVGLLCGIVAGGSAIGVMSSGAKTILALWAEEPKQLMETMPRLHAMFEEHILAKLNGRDFAEPQASDSDTDTSSYGGRR